MSRHLVTALALAAAAALHGVAAHAADLVIDDFSSGLYKSPELRTGSTTNSQLGTMAGGQRDTTLSMCTTDCAHQNPFNQAASYSIMKSRAKPPTTYALIQSAGFDAPPRLDVDYGYGTVPMNLDLTGYDRVRIDFLGLSETLNFNTLLFSFAGHYGQSGCNLPEYNAPFSVELPFDGFQQQGGGFNVADVTNLWLVFQSSSAIGSVEFGISRVVISDTPKPGATVCRLAP